MSHPIRVLLADDHALVREGLRLILESEPDIEVVGEAGNGVEAVSRAKCLLPTVVLMDLTMPEGDGAEATALLKRDMPEVQVLVLTVADSQEYFFRVLQRGASGYVVKGASKAELLTALRAVASGGVYLYPALAKGLVGDYLRRASRGEADPLDRLTEREQEVLQAITEGKTGPQIAAQLVLSPATVERHRAKLMAKLGLHSHTDLIKYASRRGLITLDEH